MNSTDSLFIRLPMSKGVVNVFTQKPEIDFLSLKQIHSAELLKAQDLRQQPNLRGDGIVQYFNEPFLSPLAIVTADCLPIFLLGERGIAALHAGWRGLKNGILRHPLVRDLNPDEAFFAPHIRADRYEVGEDFSRHFPNSRRFHEKRGRYFFDLTGEAHDQLIEQFPSITFSDSHHCTYAEDNLHSYRRGKGDERNWNIWLPRQSNTR